MPTVPESFAPSVAQGEMPTVPATGPWVSPMKNSAPSLLSQTGDTLARAGGQATQLGNTIGDAVESTMNDAMLKSATTQFLKSTQDVLYNPQSGYLNTRGMNAQTQWGPASKAVDKAQQDARATLTNPMQQRAFDVIANDHMLSVGREMNTHQHDQVTQFGIQQNQDFADSMNLRAKDAYLGGRMAEYQKNVDQARDAVLKTAELNGASPESDVTQAMLRAKHTDLVHGITIGLLDDHKYDQAKQFFEQEQPNIDMRVSELLGNAVKTEYDRNLTETKGDALLAAAQTKGGTTPYTYGPLATGSTINPMRITDVPGSPRPGGRTHDGYDIAMPAGTQVTAPLDGKVVKVWNDEQFGGGLSMRVQLSDGNTLGVAHLSAANLKEGDTVNRGQVLALSGNTGNATGNVLHVALTDPDGQHIDYFGASKAQPDQAGVADPNVLQRAIDAAKGDDSLDPYQQKRVISYMEAQHSHERAIQEQQYQDVKQQAVEQLIQSGGNFGALPAAIRTQLRPSDVLEFENRARGMTKEEQEQNQVPVIANWLEHPEQQTPAAVNEAYAKGQLTPDAYTTQLREAEKMQKDPAFANQVSIDHDQLTDILSMNQLPGLAFPKSNDDKAGRVQMETAIKQEIDLQQNSSKRKLTWDEKAKVARDMIIDKVYTSTPIFGMGGTLKPTAILKPDEVDKASVFVGGQKVKLSDIPAQYQLQATQDLRTNGLPSTQANVAAWWVKKGKPTQ